MTLNAYEAMDSIAVVAIKAATDTTTRDAVSAATKCDAATDSVRAILAATDTARDISAAISAAIRDAIYTHTKDVAP